MSNRYLKSLRNVSIFRVMIVGFTLACLLPLIAVWTWSYRTLLEKEFSRVKEQHLLLARGISEDLATYHDQVLSAFEGYVPSIVSGQNPVFASSLFTSYGFRHICVFDQTTWTLQRSFLASSAPCPAKFPDAVRSNLSSFFEDSPPNVASLSGVQKLGDRPPLLYVFEKVNNFLAVGAIDTVRFQKLQDQVHFGDMAHVAIFDRFNRVLAHPRDDWEQSAKDASELSVLTLINDGGLGVSRFYSPAYGEEMVAGYASVRGTGWKVMVPQPVKELRRSAKSALKASPYILALGLLFAAAISLAFSFSLSRSISSVSIAALELSRGKRPVRLTKETHTQPVKELSRLNAAFDKMAEKIEKGRSDEKELRVQAERNAEIAKELAATERKLRVAEEQTAENKKLEAIGRLVAGVAHDFNNLLAVIMGNLELLSEDPDSPECKEFVDQALRATERGAALTNQMLAFGRRSHLVPGQVDVKQVLNSAQVMLKRLLPANVCISINFDPDIKNVWIDENLLHTAILNLSLNARDAMPDGGNLRIEAANTCDQEANNPLELNAGEYVVIIIADSGSGMSHETLASAFDPFFTTKSVGQGAGLGLSMVQGFAKQSGGAAKLTSNENMGTTVRLYLPIASREVASEVPIQSAKGKSSLTVLVAEDEPEVLKITTRILQKAGHHVVSALSGDLAFEKIKNGLKPDVLLTDIVMPGSLLGPELAKLASSILPDLEVVFLSGYPNAVDLKNLELPEGVRLLQKPVAALDLEKAIFDCAGNTQ